MDKSNDTGKFWMMFLIAMVLMIALLIFIPQWFWLPLPFVFTGFVKGMNWI